MIRIFLTALTVCICLSCGRNNNQLPSSESAGIGDTIDAASVLNDPKNILNVQTSSFSEIDSSGVLMFPLAMAEKGRGSDIISKEMPGNTYWNIIFYNSQTGQHHLLSERKMLINNYDEYKGDGISIPQINNSLFYNVITDDYNHDKKLTSDDPQYLFITDKTGHNLQQISPSGYHLMKWNYIERTNKVIMTLRRDSNKNRVFESEDEISTFEIELGKGVKPREIFSTDFKNKLKLLFDKDWKRLKE